MKSEEFIKFSDPIKLFTLWIEEAKKKEINDYNVQKGNNYEDSLNTFY